MNTIHSLIETVMTIPLQQLLTNNKDAPFIFQKIGWILAASRLLPGLEGITEISGKNANKGFAKITDFNRDFLNIKLKDGNADGKSDGTFRIGQKTYITSAKYREGDDVSIAKDMDALNTLRATRPEFSDAAFVMFVRDRDGWIAAHKRANAKHLYPIDYAHVYDVKMFDAAIVHLRTILANYNGSINDYAVKYLPHLKTHMKLKFHQHLVQTLYVAGVFMFAMKCRAGKTVSAAFNILSQKYKMVLYITPVPSETKNPAIDTFRRYVEFDGYDIINLEAGAKIPSPLVKPTILVTSKQYLDKHHNEDVIKSIHFDAVYQDETHWAGLTDKNVQMRRSVIREDTDLILMTGTGERVRNELGLDETQIVYWNLEEEAACKRGDIEYLENVYGREAVTTALVNTFGNAKDYAPLLKSMYTEMPQLRQVIYKLKPAFLENFAEFTDKKQYSFDMKEIFRMEDGQLVHPHKVISLLKSYLGSDDGSVHNSIMDQIRALGTRTGQYGSKYYAGGGGATQLWFLPEQVEGGDLNSLSIVLKSIIDEHFPEYMTVVVNSSAKLDTREGMEKFVAEQEKLANKKQGLIILLGKMMAMGVSLPRADIVCMFNNLSKADLYTQMSMRCLTQDVGKTTGFVIDFNQKRVLEMSMALVPRCEGTGGEIIDRMTKVIAFGANSFETKDVTDVIAHFNKIWTTQAFDKVKVLGARLNNYVGALTVTAEEQKEIMKSSWVRSTMAELRERRELLDASEKIEDAEPVASSEPEKKDTTKEPETLEDVIPNFSYEVLTTIPPFVAFLTYEQKREEFIGQLLERIRDTKMLNDIFREQCGSWWKGTMNLNFINLLINIFGRCDVKASRGIGVIMSAIKSEMGSLIDDMHATLALLNSILAPKSSTQKKFGEVFTPAEFVDDTMLATYPASTWSNANGKFYDPAAGSGVFGVCVYYRLMDGLQKVFPNDVDRKKHILTNMLFMSEIGAKNVGVLKHIFGAYANIYHGDSLTFDAEKHWEIDMKDVHVIGNPPYNTSRETSTTCAALYHKFIEKYIDTCKTLLFVVPSRWFSGGNGVNGFRKMMLARRDIEFIEHIEDATTVFGPSVSIKGGINYFMKNSAYSGECRLNGTMTDLSTFEILVDSKFNGLISKMKTSNANLGSLYVGNPFGVSSNDIRITSDKTDSTIACFMSQAKGFRKYIPKEAITKEYAYWKVITTEAAHGAGSGFANTFVGSPEEVHSESYRSFKVGSESEAKSLVSFMSSKLANKMLGLRKASQHISNNTCAWIPLPPLDRVWNDESVNNYYKLTAEDIALLT
jgi:site-specific DNA-methyltransferase (adenine-specific)